jgi:hypothetical protein
MLSKANDSEHGYPIKFVQGGEFEVTSHNVANIHDGCQNLRPVQMILRLQ